jgi:hypothetical protein
MKRALRILALLVVLAGVGLWTLCGQNHGWTKTSKAVEQVDPVTEIRYPKEEKGFYPGVDFLVLATLAGAGLFAGSFLLRKH